MIFTVLDTVLYHNDSLESTSEQKDTPYKTEYRYIIMTRWSQLQNCMRLTGTIYNIYHNDSLESTSEPILEAAKHVHSYIIMTRWSQLQNAVNAALEEVLVYHNDSLESTSEPMWFRCILHASIS